MSSLDSPYLVKLHWAFQTRADLYFVMDYCSGGELFYHLQMKRFSEEETKYYIKEIAMGIYYLHQRRIMYRDLKPENCLIDANGHIKLADFGLAKII